MLTSLNAANAYSAAKGAVAPGQPAPAVQALSNAAEDFAAEMGKVDQVATGTMTGQIETQRLVQTLAEAEVAMETVVAIRDKVVEAYQEILRMPV
ncbi:flagellar hook-basal body protein FliE [Paracoccus sediminis]|uniref:Flagellar hook-basal body complex protein FliE n=1 Tax=Paracoccus sediminis TaxID=1214787 RepID=A0A238W3U2_9RHOB|nr:flagellar hook-basal body complex protein FliE [Paracoccus sediminis]TBN51550.1 flagellar hook-basal body protein FliE [Paracoccus sediminis]SNR41222.1 flagellar hook-basal body complex protein FliE [Paracoccus sediminis]